MTKRQASSQGPPPALERVFDLLWLMRQRFVEPPRVPRGLSEAAQRGDLAMVEVFLERGASPTDDPHDPDSPLAAAIRGRSRKVVERLVEAGAGPESAGAARAAAVRNVDLLPVLFDLGLDPRSDEATSAYEAAASLGMASAMRILLDQGTRLDPDRARSLASTAERNGHGEIARFLRGERSDLAGIEDGEFRWPVSYDLPDREENDWSTERLEQEVVGILRSGEVDREIDATSPRGHSVLGAAIIARSSDAALAALDRGADPHRGGGRPDWGEDGVTFETPIESAAEHGLLSVVSRLAAVARQRDLDRALARAARFGLPEGVAVLLDAGADPTWQDPVTDQSSFSEAAGPFREEIRRLVRNAVRERGKALFPAFASKGRPRKRLGKLGGVSELVEMLASRDASWTLLGVRSDDPGLSARLAEIHGAERWESDVAARELETAKVGVFVLRLVDRPWTWELRNLGLVGGSARFELGDRQAVDLSVALAAEVVLFRGSDTSGTMGASVCREGRASESIEWHLDGELVHHGPATDPASDPSFDGPEGVDRWFAARDVYLPAMELETDGFGTRLALHRVHRDAVAQLDYLVLEAAD